MNGVGAGGVRRLDTIHRQHGAARAVEILKADFRTLRCRCDVADDRNDVLVVVAAIGIVDELLERHDVSIGNERPSFVLQGIKPHLVLVSEIAFKDVEGVFAVRVAKSAIGVSKARPGCVKPECDAGARIERSRAERFGIDALRIRGGNGEERRLGRRRSRRIGAEFQGGTRRNAERVEDFDRHRPDARLHEARHGNFITRALRLSSAVKLRNRGIGVSDVDGDHVEIQHALKRRFIRSAGAGGREGAKAHDG